MANAELLLIKPVENLGNEGDTITVKAGYARNYLLPQGAAIPVNRSNRKQIEALKRRSEERRAAELDAAKGRAERLEKISIAFAVQTGPGGRMFGSITAQDVLNRLEEEGLSLEKRQLNLQQAVKTLGQHTIKVKLHPEVVVDFTFEVVSENPIEEEASEGDASASA